MAVAALKRKSEPELKTYHATVMVTRAEEWCVEAEALRRRKSCSPPVLGIDVTLASGYNSRLRVSRSEKSRPH